MYIFQDDMVDFNFLKLLKQKAKDGLRVRIILDSFGSADLAKKVILDIKESGAELIFLSYFLHKTHRKILVVDEKIAFIGGVNFHQSASLWNDLVVRVRGKLVSSIIKSFAKVYVECGGKDPLIIIENRKILKDKINDWLVEHFPVKNKFYLKRIYKNNLLKAEKNIILVTPYFMPRRWMIGALHQAVLRGVRVEVLVPRVTDHYFIDRVNYFFMYKLSKLGVNIYLESKMNHAKVMLIDSKEGIVGSPNIDYLSFELNSEVGIFFKDIKAITKLVKIVEEWKKDTILFDLKTQKPHFIDYILSPIISIFNRIL
jgi:cardiolipin synthase